MGAHYSSIQIRSEDSAAVKTAVEAVASQCKKKFLVAPPLDGWIAVYPDDNGNDERCATLLAEKLDTTILHLLVHDSDVFYYNFFRGGKLLNEYSSDPDCFEEASPEEHRRLVAQPELFRDFIKSPEQFTGFSRLLARDDAAMKFDLAEDRMERFAKILGIRNTLTSYDYLTGGEHDGVKGWKEFIHIPDLADEKAAKKAKAAALLAEKQRLKQQGLFCTECSPKGPKRRTVNMRGEFCFDPLDGSLLVFWRQHVYPNSPPAQVRLQSPWTSGPESIARPLSTGIVLDPTFSAGGKWLAFADQELKIWNWRDKTPVANVKYDGYPIEFSRDEKLLLCRTQQTVDTISPETGKVIHSLHVDARLDLPAFHPSQKFMVTRTTQSQISIVNLESGKAEKRLWCGKRVDHSALIPAFQGKLEQSGAGQQAIREWKQAFIQGSENILKFKFSPDGRLLFCGTDRGLRVLVWDQILAASETTPESLFAVAPGSDRATPSPEHLQHGKIIYDAVLDETKNRLLFSGAEGVIRFLDLGHGSGGALLDPPDKSSFVELRLSPDRKFIACLWGPPFEKTHGYPWRVQVWNYQNLCREAGLSWD